MRNRCSYTTQSIVSHTSFTDPICLTLHATTATGWMIWIPPSHPDPGPIQIQAPNRCRSHTVLAAWFPELQRRPAKHLAAWRANSHAFGGGTRAASKQRLHHCHTLTTRICKLPNVTAGRLHCAMLRGRVAHSCRASQQPQQGAARAGTQEMMQCMGMCICVGRGGGCPPPRRGICRRRSHRDAVECCLVH